MEILILKIILLGTVFTTCLTASLLPLKFINIASKHQGQAENARRHLVQRVFRLLNCFGGGVFLATCLLDLLPDVRKKLTELLPQLGIHTNFPVAEFITAVGLFLILCVEQIAHDYKEMTNRKKNLKVKTEHLQSLPNEDNSYKVEYSETERSPLLHHPSASQYSAVEQSASPVTNHNERHPGIDTNEPFEKGREFSSSIRTEGHGHSHGIVDRETGDGALVKHTESHDMVTSSSLRSLLLLLALSLHSLFEGLALGLQNDTDQLLGIFTAIVIHKTILALSLGINFVQSNLRKVTVIQSSVCFSLMAPVGIVIGVLVTEGFNNIVHGIISGILQGLATGTFLYITFFEVLPMEMSQPGDRLLKVLFTLLGFAVIVGSLFLDPTITNGD